MSAVALTLNTARTQLGTVETPVNRTKYGVAYGMDGNAWCAMFIWWVMQNAGYGNLVPKSAYTPTIADWFRARGRFGSQPRVGALVFFDFPGDGVNRISHIAIVEAINPDGSITTIEGNTSSGEAGSQRDGGGVYRRIRRAGIEGYAYPAYPEGQAPPITILSSKTFQNISVGDRNPAVAVWQKFLNAKFPQYSKLVVDGDYGPATVRTTREFQRRAGVTGTDANGTVVGPRTYAAAKRFGFNG